MQKSWMLRKILSLSCLALALSHCGFKPRRNQERGLGDSHLAFDSSRLVAVDASIAAGSLQTAVTDPIEQEKLIRKQLKYTVGQLNGLGGAPHLESFAITLGATQGIPNSDHLLNVSYSAKFLMSWPLASPIPEHLTLYLPAAGEQDFIDHFLNDVDSEGRCLDSGSHGVDTVTAFYYYRPLKASCEINHEALPSVAIIDATLSKSAVNTEGKFPEYAKIWEDGRLAVTLVFGKNDGNSMDESDAGINAYQATYRSLVSNFGKPLSSNLAVDIKAPGAAENFVQMIFQTPRGILDVDLELINHIGADDEAGLAFLQRYSDRMAIADFVSYSGHSGHGSNIAQLMKMGSFIKGQYQILRLNGCDSFAYFTDELQNAHAAVNPGESPSKYLDIISNSQPSRFSSGSWEALVVINALVDKTLTYRQILARMDTSQQNAVTGEQDNEAWTNL